MKKWKLLFMALIISGCVQNSPIEIKQYSLSLPKGGTTINKSELKSGNDYSIGYTNGNIRSNRVTLTWQKSTDTDFLCYKVFRNDIEKEVFGNNDSTTYTELSLFNNTFYDFTVFTLTKRGTGSSDTVRIKTPRFERPSIIGHEIITATSLKIYWENRAESANTFTVERIHPDSVSFNVVSTVTDTFYVDSDDIRSGETYKYRVTANSPYESTSASYIYSVPFSPNFYTSRKP